ncbi:uncharacterized protein LOC118478800 [Aplysia californica]|uniref:Uncharacterized protein LOC118478800 n=1 Tax=Aplysia californica TaxID=6500 RepID=A0ABM1W2Q6_APLCA|nr:uncharacterized protein LOC118478800 [Aplysia californica]
MEKSAGLTFAEAYYLQKQKEAARIRMRMDEGLDLSNEDQLNNLMTKIINSLEAGPPKLLQSIRSLLNKVSGNYAPLVTGWRDGNRLNILHYCIMYNRPEILSFLLSETYFFPPSHQPSICPYAHLAASLGMTDCLRIILDERPSDFFKATLPKHEVRIPEALKKKLNWQDNLSSRWTNNMDSILKMIKSYSEEAETMAELNQGTGKGKKNDLGDLGDLGDLDEELDNMERDFSKRTKQRNKRKNVSMVSREHTSVTKAGGQPESSPPPHPHRDKNKGSAMPESVCDKLSRRRRLTPLKKKEHRLFIYLDIFHDAPPGVIGGAGVPAHVTMSESAQNFDAVAFLKSNTINPVDRLSASPERRHQRGKSKSGKKTADVSRENSSISVFTPKPSKSVSRDKLSKPRTSHVFDEGTEQHPKLEMGVRGTKKYKPFRLKKEHRSVVEEKVPDKPYMNKSPLSLASERGHIECVQLILDNVILKQNPQMIAHEPLSLATKARSPGSILLLLTRKCSPTDYQSAVLTAIRELFPDCLAALLSSQSRERQMLFEGTNLFHILYSQSLIADYRYEVMPEMTRVLIACGEDVNSRKAPRTYPMYTLIKCAFNITVGQQIFFYIECLEILLDAKANPHYDEIQGEKCASKACFSVSRKGYTSAIQCVMENARESVNFFESSYWSKLFMKKIVTTIESRDRTTRRVLNNVLFEYMDAVISLGLNRTILRTLLRYGANPDSQLDGRYAMNVFFDNVLPYLTRFQVIDSYERYQTELSHLVLMCRAMSQTNLKEAFMIFLDDHLLTTPIQGLPVCRYFCYLAHGMLRAPRSLKDEVSLWLWKRLKRNERLVKKLPVSSEIISFILP